MSGDIALETILNAVLKEVCVRCDFIHAEAFKPAGNTCMVQGGAYYNANNNATDFHKASQNFHYPQYACLPGRVWKTQQTEWHQDVSSLPMPIFVRAELARVTELRACFAIPLCRQGHVISVVVFYSRSVIPFAEQLEHTVFSLANDILSEVCTRYGHPQMHFTKNGKPAAPKRQHPGTSKVWESAKASLQLDPAKRSETDVENIIKFSKRLPFFKYVTTSSREALCKTMQLIPLDEGKVAVKGADDMEYVWFIVVKGRCDMMLKTEENGRYYPMRTFEEGDTFAYSYMKMLAANDNGIEGDIRAVEPNTLVVRVFVATECRGDFRSQTKPLLYEELAKYFDMSADEAAERLGVCMSAIKKICRRHGIVRWPHRKLLSANKSLALIDSKLMEPQTPETLAALRAEAINVLVSKLRVMLNPSYISSSELIQVTPKDDDGTAARLINSVKQAGGDDDSDFGEDDDDEPAIKKLKGAKGKALPSGQNGSMNGQDLNGQPKVEESPNNKRNRDGGAAGADSSAVSGLKQDGSKSEQKWNNNEADSAENGADLSIDALSQMVQGALEKVPAHAREQVLAMLMNANRSAHGAPNAAAPVAAARSQAQDSAFTQVQPSSAGMLAPIQIRDGPRGQSGGNLVPSMEEQSYLKRLVEQQAPQHSGPGRGPGMGMGANGNGPGNHEDHIASGESSDEEGDGWRANQANGQSAALQQQMNIQQIQSQLRHAQNMKAGSGQFPNTQAINPNLLVSPFPNQLPAPGGGLQSNPSLGSMLSAQLSGNGSRPIQLPLPTAAFLQTRGADGQSNALAAGVPGHVANIHLLCDLLGGPPGEQQR